MSAQSKDNCPPQFVFEIMVSQAARRFLVEDKSAEDIVAEIVAAFEDLYSNDALVTDMIDGLERLFGFLQTVEIDDVDLLLVSYIWFVTNYESLRVERKKKQLFGNPLKGKPRLLARVYTSGPIPSRWPRSTRPSARIAGSRKTRSSLKPCFRGSSRSRKSRTLRPDQMHERPRGVIVGVRR